MRRKELSMWGRRKAWRQICVEFTQFWKMSIRHCTPTWNEVPVLIFRLHTSGGIATRWEMKCTFPYQVQLPSPSSPLASSVLLQFLSFSFCYSFSWAHFEAEDWEKTKCWLSLSDQGSRYPLPHSGLAAGSKGIHQTKELRGAGRVGGVNPGVSGSFPVRMCIRQIRGK